MSARLFAGSSLSALMLALAACATPGVSGGAVPGEAAAILDANHQAAGTGPSTGTLTLDYSFSGQGLSGTTRVVGDQAHGWFVASQDLGILKGANGYDGTHAWMRDMSGVPTPQDGGDKPALAINEAYREANLWWRSDRGGAAIEVKADETVNGAKADHLTVTPAGGKPFDVWFDATTHQILQLREQSGFQTYTTQFSDFRPEAGRVVAHVQKVDDGSGPEGLLTLKLTGANLAAPADAAAYAMPTDMPNDHAVGDGSTTVPFVLNNSHIYVQAKVNGTGPYNFIVDTGGHDIVTPDVAKALKLTSAGAVTSSGAGDKSTTAGFTHVHLFTVGGATLKNQDVVTLDFAPYELEGLKVGGMLGFEFIRRFVVRIDYGTNEMTIIDPARFDAKEAGTPVPFTFYDSNPDVIGTFDGRAAHYNIDTGSRVEVTMTAPYIAANNLRAAYPHGTELVDGWGVGGPVRSFVARVASLTMGDVAISEPVASLATSKGGAFSDSNYDGNIGSGLLKRFVVTFDYAHEVMYLKPIAAPLADTSTFDRSGLWMNRAKEGFDVVYVTAGGAGEAAGLKPGDLITAIDGKPASKMALSDARADFRVWPAGKSVKLTVGRGGKTMSMTLVLRDQVPPHAD